jgi:5-methylthioribose kinase
MDNQSGSKYQVKSEGRLYGQIAGDKNQVIQNFYLPLVDEKTKQEVKEQRRQFCVPILTSIHEIAPLLAKLREAHDNSWERQKYLLQGMRYAKEVNALFKKAHERFALAGSELSIDPDGQKVMDAMVECLGMRQIYLTVVCLCKANTVRRNRSLLTLV